MNAGKTLVELMRFRDERVRLEAAKNYRSPHGLERDQSSDAGFLDGADRASWNVPSVAPHSQNAYCSGFYPIKRARFEFAAVQLFPEMLAQTYHHLENFSPVIARASL
jgi:hypothetical protein